jgi:hypothetical protein
MSIAVRNDKLLYLISRCRYENDLDNQVIILRDINNRLPKEKKIVIASFITDDYVSRALDIIEEQLYLS